MGHHRLACRALCIALATWGCAATAPPAEEAPARAAAAPSELEQTLAGLGEEALERGELDTAEQRFRRILDQDPRSARAHIGLGRVRLARGDRDGARRDLLAAAESDPANASLWLALAEVDGEAPAAARRHLERALAVEPRNLAAHARLAALTGRDTGGAPGSLDAAIDRANAHPYDPRALAAAGRALAEAQRLDEAVPALEAALSLADLDPRAGDDALATLRRVDPQWQARRVVPVRVFVDERLRRVEGWRFHQRELWLDVSKALDPLLDTWFLPVTIAPIELGPDAAELEPILGAAAQHAARMRRGLVAVFTGAPEPRRRGARRGLADYLGRHLAVRDLPGGEVERVLAHEIVHLYGGVHVVDEVESLMNASGSSRRLDPLNVRIVRALASRGFGPGGLEENVMARIDRAEAIEAFTEALSVNLTYRQLGLESVLADRQLSRYHAAVQAREITLLDEHLADVSSFLARLLWEDGRRVEAVILMETASTLYGPRTPRGRAAQSQADGLRGYLRTELGVD